jgi:uncharacterized protein YbjT (DUF2867 family)
VPIIDSKHAVEQYLRGSGVPHTVIAPVYFMENVWNPWNQAALAAGRWPSPVTRSRPLQQIPIADVLAFTVHVLESCDGMVGQRIEIASDQLTRAVEPTVRLAGTRRPSGRHHGAAPPLPPRQLAHLRRLGRHPRLAPAPAIKTSTQLAMLIRAGSDGRAPRSAPSAGRSP